MGSNQLLVSEQLNATSMNPCGEGSSHQVRWHPIAVGFNAHQSFESSHHAVKKAIVESASWEGSKVRLFLRQQDGGRLSCCIRRSFRIDLT